MSDSATPWPVAREAPLSMGFSSQEYWSGLPFPSPGDLPNPGIEPVYLMSPELMVGYLPLVEGGGCNPEFLKCSHICFPNTKMLDKLFLTPVLHLPHPGRRH